MNYKIRDNELIITGKWPETERDALKISIEKWEWLAKNITDYTGAPDVGIDECALCHIYLKEAGNCFGCPVQRKTRKHDCVGTPYFKYQSVSGDYNANNVDKAIVAAAAEVKFLKSLVK